MTDLMPAIFFGHGYPMNALSKNTYTEGWASIGKSIPRPKAVLAVSSHWYISACAVTASLFPETIHFPVQGVDGGSVSMLAVQIG